MVKPNYHNSSSDDEDVPERQPQFGTTTNFGAPLRVGAGGHANAFETMHMEAPPVRVAGGAVNYETMNLGPAPVRVDGSAFQTVNFDAVPVRVVDKPNDAKFGPNANFGPNSNFGPNVNVFNNIHSNETPMVSPYNNPIQPTSTPQPMPHALVIANVILRPLGIVFLVIGTALIVSNSNFKASTNTKYLLATLILGIVYEVYQTISAGVRIGTGRQMLPGSISLYISYILDQIFIVLLLTAGAASAAYLKDLNVLLVCENQELKKFCNQTIASTSMAFLSFLLLGANSIISSFCFFTNKI